MLARLAIKFLNSSFQKSDPRVRGQTVSEVLDMFSLLLCIRVCTISSAHCTTQPETRNCSRFAASLLPCSHQTGVRICIACFSLLITSLLQVINRLDAN